MYFHEPMPFHMAYPVSGCYEEERILENEHALLFSYFTGNIQTLQNRIEAEADKQEYAGSMMYDEHPDTEMIRRTSRTIWDEWEDAYPDTIPEEMVYMLLVWEIFRRRSRKRRADMFL